MSRTARLSRVVFSRASDEWTTPRDLFATLDAEFAFDLDAAATRDTALCAAYRGPDHARPECRNGLVFAWARSTFVNPPYSQCRAFIGKCAEEAAKGCTVVALVPSRTDVRWWHAHVWDAAAHRPRLGVEVRFLPGRLKFGASANSAPFPSAVVVWRSTQATSALGVDPAPVPADLADGLGALERTQALARTQLAALRARVQMERP